MAGTTHDLPPALARIHRRANGSLFLRRFTLATRLLLAIAFIPTGLVKATGQRFTLLGIDDPVGFFFEAMYRTGAFWHFVGLTQILAGVLLLIPATATLGALLFLPIAVSIALITWGIGFSGTIYVTALMLLAAIYLICWDADRIWAAGASTLRRGPKLTEGMHRVEVSGWGLGGLAGLALLLNLRGFGIPGGALAAIVSGLLALALGLVGLFLSARQRQTARAAPAPDRTSAG